MTFSLRTRWAGGVAAIGALGLILTGCAAGDASPAPSGDQTQGSGSGLDSLIAEAKAEGSLDLVWGEGVLGGTDGTPKLAEELIEYCRERLSHFKCPREVRFVESLPRLPNGKLLKRMLTAPR